MNGPRTANWTVSELLDWFGEEESRIDDELDLLTRVDARLGGPQSPDAVRPGAIALLRSIVRRVLDDPTLGERSVAAMTHAARERRAARNVPALRRGRGERSAA